MLRIVAQEFKNYLFHVSPLSSLHIDRVDNLVPTPDVFFEKMVRQDQLRQNGEFGISKVAYECELVSPASARANARVCRAIMALALSGDGEAKKRYEQKRLIQFEFMPEWAQTACRKEMAQAVDDSIENIRRQYKVTVPFRWKEGLPDIEKVTELRLFRTYSEMRRFLHASAVYYKENGVPLTTKDLKRASIEGKSFFPVSSSVLALPAHKAFERGAKFLVAVRVLMDIAEIVNVSLSEEKLLELVTYHKHDPWGMVKDSRLLRMLRVRDYLNTSPDAKLADGKPKYDEAAQQALLQTAWVTLPSELQGGTSVAARKASKSKESPAREKRPNMTLKNQLIEGIVSLVEHRGFHVPRGVSRELAKQVARGCVTLEQLDAALSSGQEPHNILQSVDGSVAARQVATSLETSTTRTLGRDESQEASSSLREHAEEHATRGAKVVLSRVSKGDFRDLDQQGKELVYKNLVSLHDTGLAATDYKRLTALSKIIELRPGSYRVYLTQIGRDEYKVLKIGPKKNQRRDLRWLKRISF